jgi:predicted 3-demethylubiquinone-9 3-methyltransferase (glyoxalase superfamily)
MTVHPFLMFERKAGEAIDFHLQLFPASQVTLMERYTAARREVRKVYRQLCRPRFHFHTRILILRGLRILSRNRAPFFSTL